MRAKINLIAIAAAILALFTPACQAGDYDYPTNPNTNSYSYNYNYNNQNRAYSMIFWNSLNTIPNYTYTKYQYTPPKQFTPVPYTLQQPNLPTSSVNFNLAQQQTMINMANQEQSLRYSQQLNDLAVKNNLKRNGRLKKIPLKASPNQNTNNK